MLCDLQFTDALISTVVLFDVAFTFSQVWTKGHIGHLLHFFIPRITLPGLLGASDGTLGLFKNDEMSKMNKNKSFSH